MIDALGIRETTIDISAAVDGYAQLDQEIDGRRKGNIMARLRMTVRLQKHRFLNQNAFLLQLISSETRRQNWACRA